MQLQHMTTDRCSNNTMPVNHFLKCNKTINKGEIFEDKVQRN